MSEIDKYACEALAAQLWPNEPNLRAVAAPNCRSKFGIPAQQKAIVTNAREPRVLAMAGSWSKLASDLRKLRDVKPAAVR